MTTDPNVQIIVEQARKELQAKLDRSMKSIEDRNQQEIDRIARLIGPVPQFVGKLSSL